MILVDINLTWLIIFIWTIVLSSLCILFGFNLLMKVPRRYSSFSLGFMFIGFSISFLTYPFIILNDILAIWFYKFQIIGYIIICLSVFIFGRSLTKKITGKYSIAFTIPGILIILLVWIFTPLTPVVVSYGFELDIDYWFMGFLATYGYISLSYIVIELVKIHRTTRDAIIRKRTSYLIFGYISIVITMTLLLSVLPIVFDLAEIKPFGFLVATISMIFIYQGYRPEKHKSNICVD